MTSVPILALAGLIGLVIGSFLNVLIFRGPAIWNLIDPQTPRGSLWGPRSQCPHCQTQIRSWHNIPVISYFLLRGKCADCNGSIPAHYPLVEGLGAIAAIFSVLVFGWSFAALGAAVYLWILIALGFIDYQTGYLPDMLTLPLIALGLITSWFGFYVPFIIGLVGAVIGFLTFWLIALYYRRLRGKEGMGLGDAKLLSALGAWCGSLGLAPIVLIASVSALAWVGVTAIKGKSIAADTPIRFGPALAMAGIIVFIGQNLTI